MLVVEDERLIADVLDRYLRNDGLRTTLAVDADEALAAARNRQPDIVLIDVNLPGRDGFALLAELRVITTAPVIMVTARVDDEDRLRGFELGADDYVVKPFNPVEVVARVRGVLRRTTADVHTDRPRRFGDVEVFADARIVTVAGARVDLTASEYAVLDHLARHPGIAVSRSSLLAVLEESTGSDRVVDAHVKSIRRKLRTGPDDQLIETVRGFGYRLWPTP